jgi:hypothetical protein
VSPSFITSGDARTQCGAFLWTHQLFDEHYNKGVQNKKPQQSW